MRCSLIIILFAVTTNLIGQQEWMPIPQQSTLILQNQQTHEVIPLRVDSSIGSHEHFIWLKHGLNHGICSSRVLKSRQIITGFTIGDSISLDRNYSGSQKNNRNAIH